LDRYFLQYFRDGTVFWETGLGKSEAVTRAVSFTPDDRSVLTYNRIEQTTWVALIEARSGKQRYRFDAPLAVYAQSRFVHAYSKDGGWLA
jgi:hypothetical protein